MGSCTSSPPAPVEEKKNPAAAPTNNADSPGKSSAGVSIGIQNERARPQSIEDVKKRKELEAAKEKRLEAEKGAALGGAALGALGSAAGIKAPTMGSALGALGSAAGVKVPDSAGDALGALGSAAGIKAPTMGSALGALGSAAGVKVPDSAGGALGALGSAALSAGMSKLNENAESTEEDTFDNSTVSSASHVRSAKKKNRQPSIVPQFKAVPGAVAPGTGPMAAVVEDDATPAANETSPRSAEPAASPSSIPRTASLKSSGKSELTAIREGDHDGFSKANKELALSDTTFKETFGVDKEGWKKTPAWKRKSMKMQNRLM